MHILLGPPSIAWTVEHALLFTRSQYNSIKLSIL